MRRWQVGVAAAVLLVTGCGAVANEEPDLAAAVESTEGKHSWRLAVEGLTTEDGKQIRSACRGAADHERRRAELTCTVGGEAGFEVALRAIGDDVYYRDTGVSGSTWQKEPDDGGEDPVAELSPHRLLSLLRGASVASEYGGDETVRDASTTRYRLTVNCEDAELTDCGGDTAPVDVWIAEDDTVRKISVDWGVEAFTVEFFDFGADVDIQPPPADESEPLDDEPSRCDPESGRPIRASQALAVLNRAGFSVKLYEHVCFAGLAAAFDNTRAPRAREGEGLVMCHLFETSSRSATDTVVRGNVDGGDAELLLANLECSIFTDRPNPGPEIERLERAFRELER